MRRLSARSRGADVTRPRSVVTGQPYEPVGVQAGTDHFRSYSNSAPSSILSCPQIPLKLRRWCIARTRPSSSTSPLSRSARTL